MCFRGSPLSCLSPWNAAYLPLPRSPSSASEALPTLGRLRGILPHCRPSLFRWSVREVLRAGPVRRVEEKCLCPPATGPSDQAASVSALPVSLHDYSNDHCSCYRPALHHRLRHPRRLLSYIISLHRYRSVFNSDSLETPWGSWRPTLAISLPHCIGLKQLVISTARMVCPGFIYRLPHTVLVCSFSSLFSFSTGSHHRLLGRDKWSEAGDLPTFDLSSSTFLLS